MPGTASTTVIPFEKDPAKMTDRELFDHIQYLKRIVMQRAEKIANTPLETLSEEEREAARKITKSDRKHLALLLPIEDELRRIYDL